MKKVFKFLGIGLLVLVILSLGACFLLSEKLPEGTEGPAAEALTDKMFDAVDKKAWDSTKLVTWNFMGIHQYLWDKETTDLRVAWKDSEVLMNLDQYDGRVTKDGKALEGEDKRKEIDKAFGFFCNDMFWLNAPVKARDEGTTRKLVKLENDEEALLVSYSSGGVTPGDSFLWILDENGRPTGWKMWTQVLPIKGLYTSWEAWKSLDTGAELATKHGGSIYTMEISEIKSAQSYEELGIENPFE
ncbi:hypothetical protein [Portibacter marinus]|uniref:hypothetical protein n=1 Tax=Portibacter marinus TaxID=2898660 RepID=UPI001F1EDE19|nr:hypothetical protein [Portibacter marinus]